MIDVNRILATINGQSFVTPALVALAFRKVYRHRIIITGAKDERSMQYGSGINAVASYLEGSTPEKILETVLQEVEVPV